MYFLKFNNYYRIFLLISILGFIFKCLYFIYFYNLCVIFQVMKLQFIIVIGVMMGIVCSLMVQGIGDVVIVWIFFFIVGGFIYIVIVFVILEFLEDIKLGQLVKEIVVFLVGVYMMVLIGQFE